MLRESQPQAERWSGDRYIKQVSLQWFLMLINYPSGILITSSIHLFFRNHCSPLFSLLSSHSNRMRERVNNTPCTSYAFSSVQSLSRVQLFATPWIAAHQASLSITNSLSLLKLMSIKWVMPFSHLILCCPLLLLLPIPPGIRVFSSKESTLHWYFTKYYYPYFIAERTEAHKGLVICSINAE